MAKKEKTVKAHQRKTKSGKIIVVKAHKAKYDAADDKKKNTPKKEGAGEEYDRYKAAMGTNPYHYRDWYEFNEWDTPEESWPSSVREADAQIKRNLKTKEAYDKYCEEIDKSWKPYGYIKMHPIHKIKRTEIPSSFKSIKE